MAKRIKIKLSIPDKYSHISFEPPKSVQANAKRALEVRADKTASNRGMTPTGIARARDLANGKTLSPDTIKRMVAYFTRHEIDKEGSTWNTQGKGWQAWMGWGGDEGYTWAKKVLTQMKTADEKTTALRAYGEAVQLAEPAPTYEVPDGLTIGKPFKTLALGQVSSRMSGESIGQEIDLAMLTEMVRVYRKRRFSDPVIIDWQHATSPFNGGPPAPPESGNALGLIIDLELRHDGLYAVPAYNERGLSVVKNAGGVLWSSPEFICGEVYTRDGGALIGTAQLLAITLTPRPAQSHDKISRVTLNERISMIDNLESMSVEDLRAMLIAKDEMVRELENKIAEMAADNEAKLVEAEDEAEQMAEEVTDEPVDEAEQMTEEEKKKDYAMSEKLAESTLLSEVQSLREANNKLSERIEAIEAEKRAVLAREAVGTLLREGRITPNEEKVAHSAFAMRELQPEFWQMFSERPANSAVPLTQIGHGASGEEITKATLNRRVQELQAEKGLTYSEALNQFRQDNPDYYAQAFGG
jgi:hypothetical protein